ncbi:hypothetical protein HMPREF9946_02623 [Acetobacteraceae bacterium AT-5844]|nr:hypothetical protein HMPREF9946_02623 [Acetobacteraceae bacterium AT-5844]
MRWHPPKTKRAAARAFAERRSRAASWGRSDQLNQAPDESGRGHGV